MGGIIGRLKVYGGDIRNMAVLFAACAFLSFLIVKAVGRKGAVPVKAWYVQTFFLVLFVYSIVQTLLDVNDSSLPTEIRLLYTAVYIPILILAFRLRKYCSQEERMAFQMGASISLGGGIAVLLLTNLTFLTTAAYLILGIMVSMLPIGAYLRQASPERSRRNIYRVLLLGVMVILLRNVYVIKPLNRIHATIFAAYNMVKAGPMTGIFNDYMGAYIRNSDWNEWHQFVHKGDRVMIVGIPASTIGYLYEDTEVSVDSTISTPTYSEKLLAYWELNPEKEPNVVVLDCWFGEPRVPADTWIMQWLEKNFETYVDGTYIRVYRRGRRN